MRATAFLVVSALLMAFAGCGGDDERPLEARELRIATGTKGGVYAAYGAGLAQAIMRHVPRLTARIDHTDGSVENLRLLERRRAQVAFTLADSASDALRGRGRFDAPVPLVALARLYDNFVQVIVRDDAPIMRMSQLAGKVVSVGARGSGTAVIAERILALLDLEGTQGPRRVGLDIADSARALADGEIDAFFWSGGLPTSAISDLQDHVPIRLLDLRGLAQGLRRRYGTDVYTESRVSRAVYGVRSAVTTVSVPNLLVVRRDFNEEAAYRLTRLLLAGHSELRNSHREAMRLNARAASTTYPLSLHPGAERWYSERR